MCLLCYQTLVLVFDLHLNIAPYYFGGARCKGFATLRNVQSWYFWDKIGHAKDVGFRLIYSASWRSESRIGSRHLEITSTSLIYSLTHSRKKELLFWLSRSLNLLTCVTRQIRGVITWDRNELRPVWVRISLHTFLFMRLHGTGLKMNLDRSDFVSVADPTRVIFVPVWDCTM